MLKKVSHPSIQTGLASPDQVSLRGGAPGKFPIKTHTRTASSHSRRRLKQNVSLWDRVSEVQVDPASAPGVCDYFRHHRHRGAVWMGGGRERQDALRQHVAAVPRPRRPVELPVPHGVP